ncbi:hypothetical protein AMTRI_Chr13g121850 [Amborella trichopoda]
MDMNLNTRCAIDLELGSNSVGSGTETSTKVETPIEDYPIEVDYDDFGCCNEMKDINDFDSDGSNKFDVYQDTEDAYETNMDEPQGFEFCDNVPKEVFKSHNETPVMKTASRMEKQMAEIDTPTIFLNFFQPKLMETINLICEVQEEDEVVCTFSLKEYGVCCRAHMVAFRNTEEKATCSCHLYERMGIPCSHMLRVFLLKNIIELPQQYIMKRWTKNVTKGIGHNDCGIQVQSNCEDTYSTLYNDLFRRCNILSVNGAVNVGLYEYAKMAIDEACDKVAARIEMEKDSAIQASSSHSSLAYTGSPCVTPILFVV